jgi:hypothetical protein
VNARFALVLLIPALIGLGTASAHADDGSDRLLAVPRAVVRLAIPELAFANAPIARSSLMLRAPAAHQEMCLWAVGAYGATLDHVDPSCEHSGILGVFETAFLRKVIYPLLMAATVLDGRLPDSGFAGNQTPTEPAESFSLADPSSGLLFRPSFVGFHGATLRATLLFE